MHNLFDTPQMAAGYASSRPAIHPQLIERMRAYLAISARVRFALDVGCGAGSSTAPLERIAEHIIGIDPSIEMLRCARKVAPGALFAAACAEALPAPAECVDVITAAGSLNSADLTSFLPEARRVLTPAGRLIIYDFRTGRDFRDSGLLSRWFDEFERRYPWPPSREITPESLLLTPFGLRASGHEWFEIGLTLSPDEYVGYLLTETNVAAAIERGRTAQEIRAWCEQTLADVFRGPAEVLFRGYIQYVEKSR
jgi:SAM-dependent methyltransferase